jgi:hypothetical protein
MWNKENTKIVIKKQQNSFKLRENFRKYFTVYNTIQSSGNHHYYFSILSLAYYFVKYK